MHVKTTTLLLFFLWLVKLFEKLVNNSIVDHLAKWDFFTSSMVLGLLDQLQILLQLYLVELLGLLTDLRLLEL